MAKGKAHIDLTRGAPWLLLTKLGIPMSVGIFAMLGFGMIDTYFVGQLGPGPLAAMTVTFPVAMVVISLSLGLSVSTSIAVAREIGSGGDPRRITTDAILLGCAIAVVLWIASLFFLEDLVLVVSGGGAAHDYAMTYLRIWFIGVPLIFVPMTGNMAIRATGDTTLPSVLMVFWMAINAVLDPIFIFGWAGFPAFGIAGAAWATVIARLFSCIAVLAVLYFRVDLLASPFVAFKRIRTSWVLLLRNALPIAMNNLITPFKTGVLTRMVASYGEETLGGMGVGMKVESFVMTVVFALQAVVGVFVGQNIGAGRVDRVESGVRWAMRFGFFWGTGAMAALLLCGSYVASGFNNDPIVVGTAVLYFIIAGVGFGARGVYLLGSAALNSLEKAAWATSITLVCGFIVTVSAAWAGGRIFGLAGVFSGLAVGNLLAGIVTIIIIRIVLRGLPRSDAGLPGL